MAKKRGSISRKIVAPRHSLTPSQEPAKRSTLKCGLANIRADAVGGWGKKGTSKKRPSGKTIHLRDSNGPTGGRIWGRAKISQVAKKTKNTGGSRTLRAGRGGGERREGGIRKIQSNTWDESGMAALTNHGAKQKKFWTKLNEDRVASLLSR